MASVTAAGTRGQIIRAAERLFAERGIYGVSLREINRAAGQSNTGAVQYHFGDRMGLLRAVMAKHRRDTEIRRHALLDQYEEAGRDDLRALAAALVMPLSTKLSDPDGGPEYLQIASEFFGRPGPHLELVPDEDPGSSVKRWHRLVEELPEVARTAARRSRFAAIRFAFVELAWRAAEPPHRDDRLFSSHLTDLVTAVLESRPSQATTRLSEQGRREPTHR